MKLHRCHFSAHGLVRAYSHLKAGRRLCRAMGLRFWPLIPGSVNSMTAAYNVYRTLRGSGLPWPETIMDIGANESQMARLLLAMNPGARVISFEPNPTVSPIGEVMRVALSDTDGEAELVIPADDAGWGTIEHRKDRLVAEAKSFRVRMNRLDTLVREGQMPWEILKRPIMAKIDTEGSEKRVVEGFGACLSDVAYLLVEVENTEQRGQSYNLVQLSNTLSAHGFDQCKIVYACYDGADAPTYAAVSYTHLTLPTIYSV